MALIPCKECGANIYSRALRCAQCGAPNMQAWWWAVIPGVIVGALGVIGYTWITWNVGPP